MGFLEDLSLLLVLNPRFQDVGDRNLAGAFQPLRILEKQLRSLSGLLGCCVFPLGRDESVVILRHGHHKPTLRDFNFGIRESHSGVGSANIGLLERICSDVFMADGPRAIDVNSVVGDKPAAGSNAVALCAEILSRTTDRRQ